MNTVRIDKIASCILTQTTIRVAVSPTKFCKLSVLSEAGASRSELSTATVCISENASGELTASLTGISSIFIRKKPLKTGHKKIFSHPDCNRRSRNHTGSCPKLADLSQRKCCIYTRKHRRWGISPRPEEYLVLSRDQLLQSHPPAVLHRNPTSVFSNVTTYIYRNP